MYLKSKSGLVLFPLGLVLGLAGVAMIINSERMYSARHREVDAPYQALVNAAKTGDPAACEADLDWLMEVAKSHKDQDAAHARFFEQAAGLSTMLKSAKDIPYARLDPDAVAQVKNLARNSMKQYVGLMTPPYAVESDQELLYGYLEVFLAIASAGLVIWSIPTIRPRRRPAIDPRFAPS